VTTELWFSVLGAHFFLPTTFPHRGYRDYRSSTPDVRKDESIDAERFRISILRSIFSCRILKKKNVSQRSSSCFIFYHLL